MRHLKKRRKLSMFTAHRNAVLINLCKSLIQHSRIRTTKAKAKTIQPFIEKLITRAKVNSLHNKRIVASRLRSWSCIPKLFDQIGPKFKSRAGGYTRIIRLGFRGADSAEMAQIEFIEDFSPVKEVGPAEEKAKTKPAKSESKTEKKSAKK